MIRVGLTGKYLDNTGIAIDNRGIKIGFSKEDKYYITDILRSDKGIVVARDYGVYNIYAGSFSSYAKAAAEAANLKAFKKTLTVVPVLTGLDRNNRGVWKLYDIYTGENALITNDVSVVSDRNRNSKYLLSVTVNGGKFLVDAEKAGANPQFEAVNINEGVALEGGNKYSGRIEIGTFERNGVTAVNVVDIEEYVRGVVPMEMSYTWHSSALKAQAVCARSYGAAVSGFGSDGNIKKGYKLTDTISHQSYGGMNVRRKETDYAVKSTENEFVTYNNRVVKTTYFSTSGGYTESSENVWGSKKAWLRAVPDKYENKPEKKPWVVGFTKKDVGRRVSGYASAKGVSLGDVVEVKIGQKSESGRVIRLDIIGRRGQISLEKQEIRKAFALYSTKFDIVPAAPAGNAAEGDFIFSGSGYGHGVGLSQSGARGMAEAGFGYKKILMYYYTGIRVN